MLKFHKGILACLRHTLFLSVLLN